jgi:hypothetical protein
VEDHEPARDLLRGYLVCDVLNLITEEDRDNLGKKGGGKRYYGTTPIGVSGESREDQALHR